MRFKLDENFDIRLVRLFLEAGHKADTVLDERLSGSSDEVIYQVCRDTRRVLVTLDLDFSNPLRFPPDITEGLIVIRPPRAVFELIKQTLATLFLALKSKPLKGRLWIVEPGRIRLYTPFQMESDS